MWRLLGKMQGVWSICSLLSFIEAIVQVNILWQLRAHNRMNPADSLILLILDEYGGTLDVAAYQASAGAAQPEP
jgi:hypothetical protein